MTGSQGNWQLTVGGKPYHAKGLAWGPSVADAARYTPDPRSMGVNTVRTWGTDGSSKPLLDEAAAHGIRTTETGNGDSDMIDASATARHVRLQLKARGTAWATHCPSSASTADRTKREVRPAGLDRHGAAGSCRPV